MKRYNNLKKKYDIFLDLSWLEKLRLEDTHVPVDMCFFLNSKTMFKSLNKE